MKTQPVKNLFYSAAVLLILFAVIMLIYYPNNGGLGTFFSVAIVMLFQLGLSILLGIVMLVLRLVKLTKPTSFTYVLSGTLLTFMGVYGIILMMCALMTEPRFILLNLFTLIFGAVMLYDSFTR